MCCPAATSWDGRMGCETLDVKGFCISISFELGKTSQKKNCIKSENGTIVGEGGRKIIELEIEPNYD